MDFKIACASWIKEEDERVLTALQKSDKWLTNAELAEITGLPQHRVNRTLRLLQQQMEVSEKRKNYFSEAEN